MKRLEIVMVLIVDASGLMGTATYPNSLAWAGYAIVMVCVVLMAAANDIQNVIDNKLKSRKSQEEPVSVKL